MICTFCSANQYFSHRKKQETSGLYIGRRSRFASFIGLGRMNLLNVAPRNFKEAVKTAVKFIKQGKVLVCPTDTVYIPAADATNNNAVRKVFLIKQRQLKKPTPIFVKDIKMAKKLAHINKRQEEFLKKIWPGQVTAVLKRKKSMVKVYGVAKKTIALRIPDYRLINILLSKVNRPLTGTSANISGRPASTKIKEVLKQFSNQKHQPDLIISAGNLPERRPSKVIDLTVYPPKVLRGR